MAVKDLRTDPVLTEVSVKYSNQNLIAERVFPRMNVKEKTGYYYTFDKSNFKIEESYRAPHARANRVDYGFSKTAYGPLTERSLEAAIDWEERDSYPVNSDIYADSVETVSERMALAHESEVATMLGDTAQVTQNVTLSGTDQWSDFSNSDPFANIETGRAAIHASVMRDPNVLILGKQVWDKVKHHPDLIDRLSNSSVRVLTRELLAALLEVEEVIIGDAMYNSADEGQTASMSYVWGKNAVLAVVDRNVRPKMVTVGLTLTMDGFRYVDRWTEEGTKEDFVRVNDYYDPTFVASGAAYLIKNAVA